MAISLKLERMLIKRVGDKKSVCGCVYLYPCDFTYVCIASELIRGADLTALVPEHTSYLPNMLSELGNEASFNMPERAILQLSLSVQMESDFNRLFAPSQALNSLHPMCQKLLRIWLLTLPN